MLEFNELPEQAQRRYYEMARGILIDLLWCRRVWEAWDVGTMTRDDFIRADEDDEILGDTAEALYRFQQQEED